MNNEIVDPETDAEPSCCDVAIDKRHPACWPIEIPANDEFYSLFRRKCMEFVRSATGLKEHCKLGLQKNHYYHLFLIIHQYQFEKKKQCDSNPTMKLWLVIPYLYEITSWKCFKKKKGSK